MALCGVCGHALSVSLPFSSRRRWAFGASPLRSGMGMSLSYIFSTHMSPMKRRTNCCSWTHQAGYDTMPESRQMSSVLCLLLHLTASVPCKETEVPFTRLASPFL